LVTRLDQPPAVPDDLDDQDLIPPKRPNPWVTKYGKLVFGALGLGVFLVVWWLVVATGYISNLYLATPQDTAKAFVDGLLDGSLSSEVVPSVQRALIGFVIALVAGIGLGIVVGSFQIFQTLAAPVLLFFRNLSLLALLPVFVVFLGIGEESKVAIVVWACFWPIFVNAVGAVGGVERLLLNSARALHLPPCRSARGHSGDLPRYPTGGGQRLHGPGGGRTRRRRARYRHLHQQCRAAVSDTADVRRNPGVGPDRCPGGRRARRGGMACDGVAAWADQQVINPR
jgi:hypothetical protein